MDDDKFDIVTARRFSRDSIPRIYDILSQLISKRSLTDDYDRTEVCIIMLLCRSYSLNAGTFHSYNNDMIHAMWNCIDMISQHRVMSLHAAEAKIFKELVGSRSAAGFRSLHMRTHNDSMIRRTKTSQSALNSRTAHIQSREGDTVTLSSNCSQIEYKSLYICRSYESMIRLVLNLVYPLRSLYNIHSSCECTDKIDAIDITDSCINVPFCIEHGHCRGRVCHVPCDITMTDTHSLILVDDQVMNPMYYYDSPVFMPTEIGNHINRWMKNEGYAIPFHMMQEKMQRGRECIVYSQIRMERETIILWSIRPTLNFCTILVRCHTGAIRTEISAMRRAVFNSICPYDPSESLVFTMNENADLDDDISEICVRGPACPYLLPPYSPAREDMRVVSVSIGSCTFQISVISSDYETERMVIPLCPNANLIHILCNRNDNVKGNEMYIHSQNRNKVTIHNTKRTGEFSGSSMCLGCNGGMQWMGSPSDFPRTFSYFCRVIEANSKLPGFIRVIRQLKIMNQPIYPAGESRRKIR